MSTEPGGVESDSNADFAVKASRFDYGVAHASETLTDATSFQAQQDLVVVKPTGVEGKGSGSALDDKDLDSHGDSLCDVVDSGVEPGGFGESRNLDGSGEEESKFENLDGVVSSGSDMLKSSKDKNGFANENLKLSDSDLVWAKVRSYPWWPGQVFDASKIAKKHFKKGNVFVAYFGDCTFAWINASRIKPFHQHFSLMQEQSNSAPFRDAIDCALEEVSRRVEFGLSCSCISEEAYIKLKTQNIVSAGIREESRVRYGGDKLSNAISFKPVKLVESIRRLACFPDYDATEELQFVINRAQVLAFQQWKDYSHSLDYETFIKSIESTASLPKANTVEGISSRKRKTGYKDNAEHKEGFDSEDRTDEETKERTLSDLIVKRRCGGESTEKLDGKSHSEKKRKAESLESGKSEKRIKNNRQKEDSVSKISDEENNFAVGDTNKLQMAAEPCYGIGGGSEINSLTPALRPCDDSNSTTKLEVENEKTKKPKQEELAERKISSSGLQAAKTPTGIPESISIDPLNYEDFEKFINELSCSKLNNGITETEPGDKKDSAEDQILPANKEITGSGLKEQTGVKNCSADSSAPNALILNIGDSGSVPPEEMLHLKGSIAEKPGDKKDSEEVQILPANKEITGSGLKEQIGVKDCSADSSAPYALILKFADSGSVPSVEKLNEIFNRYGPLYESKTKVTKKGKRARVLFKKSEDAKTAFSSAGKYSIFGPSLLSYRLEYVCPKAKKSNNMTV
ncbi:PREDICTED: uncharacterized protein LOC104734309 [Camelina sativa]|uniref:Uncharacterized protein LOC104734309 n=1 Tax=Camelina sativa TaxID=90675 RepID=A0ABM0V7K5_CAMSA|nr:PREDICTED: uncharacterized protein LOC104734309 [Camelina sativa]